INENKLWTIFFVIANIWKLFSNIIENRIYDYKFLIFIPNLVATIYIGVFCIVSIIKIGNKIENKIFEYNLKDIMKKYLITIAILVIAYLVAAEIIYMIANFQAAIFGMWWLGAEIVRPLYVGFELFLLIFCIVIVILFLVVFGAIIFLLSNIFYFVQIYCIRNISVQEAFRLNLKLLEGNRLRILIPVVSLAAVNFILTSPFSNIAIIVSLSFLKFLPIYAVFPISIIIGTISSLLIIFIITISVIIYLNVEYDYVKKHNKNLERK
ncbi:hypothetical protein, partial [Leptotrichia buccalis]